MSYTTMDRIFTKFAREVSDEFDEGDLIEMAGEALEFINAPKSYEPYVAFIEVRNHQCPVPKGTHLIHQIARNNAWTSAPHSNCMCPAVLQNHVLNPNVPEAGCVPTSGVNPCVCPPSDAVWLDCEGKPIVAYDLAYYRPFFNLKLESFNVFSDSVYYGNNFTPIRLSTNTMFGSLVCNPRPSPYMKGCKDEYQIVHKDTLRFSFRDGAVAIAYDRQMLDFQTGYPMIPDDISFVTAISKYIRMTLEGKKNYGSAVHDKLVADWHWYCGQASNNEKMIHGIDEHQNFLDQRQHLLPVQNSFYGFFGNLNNAEQRTWNDRSPGSGNIWRGEGVRPVGSGGDDILINNSTEIIEDNWEVKQW